MKFFRNPEVVRTLFIHGIVTFIVSLYAFWKDVDTGAAVFVLCIVFITIYLVSTYKRYKKIEELSNDINGILHGDMTISFDAYSEGELGILQSEIEKMIVRLREQQQLLLNEKKYLADSLADISHQIKTPLTSINLLVSFLRDTELSEEKRIKYVNLKSDVCCHTSDFFIK